jgi:predicted phage terminase large subunit-like protein
VRSDFYGSVFPEFRLRSPRPGLGCIRTRSGGYRRYATPQGPATGLGADLIIVDDIIKVGDALSLARLEEARRFYDETLLSRLNDKRTGRVIVTQQRVHEQDLPGYLIERGGFEVLSFPARAERHARHRLYGGRVFERRIGDLLDPDREDQDVLEKMRRQMGPRVFNAQYQQNPSPGESAFLRLEDLSLVDDLPDQRIFVRRVQSWDLAVNDGPRCCYSVGMTFGWHRVEELWYLLEVLRARMDYTRLKETVIQRRRAWRADQVLIENTALGAPLLQELRPLAYGVYRGISPTTSKLERFIAQTDWLKAGQLVIPSGAPWFDAFKHELLAFPDAPYDDQVDALSQFAKWIRRRQDAYLDTDPDTGRRIGNYRPSRPRPEDRMRM